MDDEVGSRNADVRSSYWLDACEDDYFVHLGANMTAVPESCSQDGSHDLCFFDGSEPSKRRRVWDRTSGRKRHRGSDDTEMDVRGRDRVRRRERYNSCSWKDRESREAKGFWERDKATNELVFQVGSWESCRNKNEKPNDEKISKDDENVEENKLMSRKRSFPRSKLANISWMFLNRQRVETQLLFLKRALEKH
ncbi:endoribonuclease Dicer1-like [Dorcoceras hygrometricum]|uniref:Endoribonuclease Dicer1-like n=1 Tax=Dorcoceras hygrometricum TaxID=472368 RepID=A0A2Z7DB75_9LAMI|nr:endoribonuclease Dicer1-like [Dorcoceras hygrometricum]